MAVKSFKKNQGLATCTNTQKPTAFYFIREFPCKTRMDTVLKNRNFSTEVHLRANSKTFTTFLNLNSRSVMKIPITKITLLL